MVNFKKVQEIESSRKGGKIKTKAVTKVQIDVLLHVLPEEGEDDNIIPKPCGDGQVSQFLIMYYYKS